MYIICSIISIYEKFIRGTTQKTMLIKFNQHLNLLSTCTWYQTGLILYPVDK